MWKGAHVARRRGRSSSVGHGTAPPRSLSVAPVIMDLSAVAAAGPGADAAWRPVPGGPGASHRGLHLLYRSDATFFLTLWLPVGGLLALPVCTYGAVSPCANFFSSCPSWPSGRGACSVLPFTYCGHPSATVDLAPRRPGLPPSSVFHCAALSIVSYLFLFVVCSRLCV